MKISEIRASMLLIFRWQSGQVRSARKRLSGFPYNLYRKPQTRPTDYLAHKRLLAMHGLELLPMRTYPMDRPHSMIVYLRSNGQRSPPRELSLSSQNKEPRLNSHWSTSRLSFSPADRPPREGRREVPVGIPRRLRIAPWPRPSQLHPRQT